MKKLIILTLLIVNLFSHSQTPSTFGGEKKKLETISMTKIKTIPIKVQNLNNYEQQYYIEIDGTKAGKTKVLQSKQNLQLNIPVKINEANTLELHKICTISIQKDDKELFQTKICTKAYLYWLRH